MVIPIRAAPYLFTEVRMVKPITGGFLNSVDGKPIAIQTVSTAILPIDPFLAADNPRTILWIGIKLTADGTDQHPIDLVVIHHATPARSSIPFDAKTITATRIGYTKKRLGANPT